MNNRLQQFLRAENLTQAQFADSLGVARASVSHILSGRNKPGFDFVENLAMHYPALNLEWFITGKGKMYKSALEPPAEHVPELFPADNIENQFQDEYPLITESNTIDKSIETVENKRSINKIILFYNDGSFEEFTNV